MVELPFSTSSEVAVSFDNASRLSRLRLQTTAANRQVRAMVLGYYWLGHPTRQLVGFPGALPPNTVVCQVADPDELRRLRPGWPKRLRYILYVNVDPVSFEQALRDELAANALNRALLAVEWALFGNLRDDREQLERDFPNLEDRYIHLVMTGRAASYMDGGTILGNANGPSPRGFVTLDIILVSADGVETPITFFQDLPVVYNAIVAPTTNPLSGHNITNSILPIQDTNDRVVQNRHNRERDNFYRGDLRVYIYPREYTNPAPLPSALSRRGARDQSDDRYEPRNQNTCVVGCREFHVPGAITYNNWSSPNVWHYDTRVQHFRITTVRTVGNIPDVHGIPGEPRVPAVRLGAAPVGSPIPVHLGVRAIVIHDTTNNRTDPAHPAGWVSNSQAIAAHLLVSRNGTVSQFADLLERVNHAGVYNDTSIGIEVANDIVWQHDRDFSNDRAADPSPHGWGERFRIPPDDCLKALWALVEWLTSPTGPLAVPRVFPQLDPRYWTQAEVNSLPHSFIDPPPGGGDSRLHLYTNLWTGLNLPRADGTKTGTRYWHVHLEANVNHRLIYPGLPGIYSHNVISDTRRDGVFNILYLWRRAKGDNNSDAINNARRIIEQSSVVPAGRSNVRFVPIPNDLAAGLPPRPP